MQSPVVPGGWTAFRFTVTDSAKKVLEAAFMGLLGVKYTPLAFATQVVEGTNYCFLCEGHVIVPSEPEFAAMVYICEPLQGEPHVTEISRINP